ncbi:MAG: hypothetical protein ACLQVK_20255 [Acidimicrobiales bacterium]|jgi:hypothetical protein
MDKLSHKSQASTTPMTWMIPRALAALLVPCLAAAAPARALPSPTRAPTATTVPVAVASGNELTSLLGVYNTLYYNHEVLRERLSGLETMCEDAQTKWAACRPS